MDVNRKIQCEEHFMPAMFQELWIINYNIDRLKVKVCFFDNAWIFQRQWGICPYKPAEPFIWMNIFKETYLHTCLESEKRANLQSRVTRFLNMAPL